MYLNPSPSLYREEIIGVDGRKYSIVEGTGTHSTYNEELKYFTHKEIALLEPFLGEISELAKYADNSELPIYTVYTNVPNETIKWLLELTLTERLA